MDEFSYALKIPKERVAVLIGKEGSIKKKVEEETATLIKIDSDDGDVLIKGEDALKLYTCREIVKAIGRGFNPEIALLLLKYDYSFEMISLNELLKPGAMERIKGRIIGTEGKSRKTIEELTRCYISVYGKTVGIIGQIENVAIARQAIESLIKGSMHSSVYKFLERKRRETKGKDIL
jgi:ribosomal RNA assembly protein